MRDVEDIRTARAALSWLFEPGDPQMRALITRYGPVEALARLTDTEPDEEHLRLEVRHLPGRARDLAAQAVHEAQAWCRIVIPEDVDWPTGLHALTGADGLDPVCLWARGTADLPVQGTSVTVTGARAATAYGTAVTADLVTGLTDRDRTIVSTGDFGVGSAALRATIAAYGSPVAVLSSGLQHPYPRQHAPLLQQVADVGLLVSVWPPDARPTRHRARAGRTVLAALTAGTVLVEDHLRGSMQDVLRHALSYGRAGLVVPGPVVSMMSAACHALLRDDPRVRAVATADDIIRDIETHRGADLDRPACDGGDTAGRDGER
ncbi:DNA-processing protein DprA [Dactylosporangium cerinum]|uniref:DNA-processing protein DprA n=1 Tax=Dactylosporangium cerinum TaxID=1434730 RepID=A0ABV9WG61_9ACTN